MRGLKWAAICSGREDVTWNPSDKDSGITLTNGNLTVTGQITVRATANKASGKYYYECLVATTSTNINFLIGVANAAASLSANLSTGNASTIAMRYDGVVFRNGTNLGDISTNLATNDVIGIAVDIGAGLIFFRKNGTWLNSADPVAGTGGFSFTQSGNIYPAVSCSSVGSASWTARFKAADFSNAAPTGYSPWTN